MVKIGVHLRKISPN